jgi:hypothetical protein
MSRGALSRWKTRRPGYLPRSKLEWLAALACLTTVAWGVYCLTLDFVLYNRLEHLLSVQPACTVRCSNPLTALTLQWGFVCRAHRDSVSDAQQLGAQQYGS